MSEAAGSSTRHSKSGALAVDEPGVREFLAFELDKECYALPLSSVREIMRVPSVTEVPRAPYDVRGIISVRGTVTTLIDLRRKLKRPECPISTRTRILLVDEGAEVIGLLVDTVAQVYRLREDEVELASVLGSESSAYVMGIGRPGRRSGEVTEVEQQSEIDHKNILILLDPIALLKKYGGRTA
jgi:purine-binding chemotaxis protein CheW